MFEDLTITNDDKPTTSNAVAWFEYGLKQGLKQKDPQSKWVLNENNNIICRNCGYIAPYDKYRGYCCGSYCAQCGSKMEELDKKMNSGGRWSY